MAKAKTDPPKKEPPPLTLRGVALRGAVFEDVELRQLRITDADLRDARLTDINLSGAQVEDADLSGAVLRDVDLRGARIDCEPGCLEGLVINGQDVAALLAGAPRAGRRPARRGR